MCYAAGKFGETLLQFLFVVAGFGGSNLRLDLCYAGCNGFLVACAVNDGGVLLRYGDVFSRAEHIQCSLIELDTFLLADHYAAGEGSYILKHLFAAVAEARSLDGTYLQLCTQTVDYQGGQCLAIDILGDDQQRTTALYGRLENRK